MFFLSFNISLVFATALTVSAANQNYFFSAAIIVDNRAKIFELLHYFAFYSASVSMIYLEDVSCKFFTRMASSRSSMSSVRRRSLNWFTILLPDSRHLSCSISLSHCSLCVCFLFGVNLHAISGGCFMQMTSSSSRSSVSFVRRRFFNVATSNADCSPIFIFLWLDCDRNYHYFYSVLRCRCQPLKLLTYLLLVQSANRSTSLTKLQKIRKWVLHELTNRILVKV